MLKNKGPSMDPCDKKKKSLFRECMTSLLSFFAFCCSSKYESATIPQC